MPTEIEWARLASMLWGSVPWLRAEQDVTDAASEIKAAIRNAPTNMELCEALRWLASDDGGKQDKTPSLRQVIGAVFKVRKSKASGPDQARNQGGACWLCGGKGWAPCRPTPIKFPLYSCDVPCTCPVGDAVISRGREKKGDWVGEFYGWTDAQMKNVEAHRRLAYRQGCETDAGRAAVGRDQVRMDQESDAMLAEDGLA